MEKGKKNDERIWSNLFFAWHNNRTIIFNLSENVKGEMMRLIDTDVLFTQMKEYHKRQAEEANMTGNRAVCVTWHDAIILIKNTPTVDAVPIDIIRGRINDLKKMLMDIDKDEVDEIWNLRTEIETLMELLEIWVEREEE